MTSLRPGSIKPRGPKEIIHDIGQFYLSPDDPDSKPGKSFAEYLRAAIELSRSGDDEMNITLFDHDRPVAMFEALKAAYEAIKANPDTTISEQTREALAKSYEACGCLLHSEEYVANDFFNDDNVFDAESVERGHRESNKANRSIERKSAMEDMDKLLAIQNLMVELCDHYGIPTRRNPPPRRRS